MLFIASDIKYDTLKGMIVPNFCIGNIECKRASANITEGEV